MVLLPDDAGRRPFHKLEEELEYRFSRSDTLEEALTHASYANENGINRYNERLEFLGDAVLELCVTEMLYRQHPSCDEGQLTKARSQIVREATLASWALYYGLPDFLRLSRGLEQQGGRNNPSILADGMEAVIGAVYLDGGYSAAFEVVQKIAGETTVCEEPTKDPKSRLQEWLQSRGKKPPAYRLMGRSGPDHAASFEVQAVLADDCILSVGKGKSIKSAEFDAARKALGHLEKEDKN